jgi:IS5 family transposase
MNREEIIIELYVKIEAACRSILKGRRLRICGRAPGLSEAEVLTIEIFGELQGHHTDAAIFSYTQAHWRAWFPKLGSYKAFVKQCANLVGLKQALFAQVFAPKGDLYITDGFPVPVCHRARASRCKLFPEEVSFGYCAAKNEHYYGFKGHVVIDPHHRIVGFTLTPANVDERAVLDNLIPHIKGAVLGDKGLICAEKQKELAQYGINLQTPLRDNMHDPRPEAEVNALYKIRRRVETVIGQLVEHFQFTKTKAKNLWHLNAKLIRKICAYNFSLSFC